MRDLLKPVQLLLYLFVALFFLSSADKANADIIAEFLFWDSLGDTVAKGAKAHSDYRAERKLWKDNIEAAKAELKRCDGCASARAKLKKWQGIENQFQEVAGNLAHAVGMPPLVAKWLDIDMPLATGRPPNYYKNLLKKKIVAPRWASERPSFCQKSVDVHISCLNEFRRTKDLLVASSLSNAVLPGAMCFDSGKLFDACYNKDYKTYNREEKIQNWRASGKIIPEYISGSNPRIYFGQVTDNFVPRLPPEDLVRAKLAESDVRDLTISMKKKAEGELGFIRYAPSFWRTIFPEGTHCFDGKPEKSEISRRICSDMRDMSWGYKSVLLICGYTNKDGSASKNHYGTFYWYGTRPDAADPARLLSRAHTHPMLRVEDARVNCPASKEEAKRITTSYQEKISRVRASTQQISVGTVLPESVWAKKRRERNERNRARSENDSKLALAGMQIEGRYRFYTAKYGSTNIRRNGACTLIKTNTNEYDVFCVNSRRHKFQGKASVEGSRLVVAWAGRRNTKVYFKPRSNNLSGSDSKKRIYQSLHRIGPVSLAAIEVPKSAKEAVRRGRQSTDKSIGPASKNLRKDEPVAGRAAPNNSSQISSAVKIKENPRRDDGEKARRRQAVLEEARRSRHARRQESKPRSMGSADSSEHSSANMSRLSKADVAGVLLGMDFVKAESIIRKRLDVGTVVEGQSAGSFNPFNQFRGFHGKNGSESIVLFRASAQNNKVIAAVYAKRQNERFDPKLVARRLKKKYGDNLHIDRTNMGLWSASMDPNSCNVRIGQTRSARYLKTITRFGTSQPYTPTLSVPGYKKGRLPSESTWEKCGPTVKYELRSTELRIVLFNLAEYGAQVLRTSKAAGVK